VVTRLRWAPAYRLISSRYPTVSVYGRIADPRDFAAVLEIEALTNPRVREETGDHRKIRAEDLITGDGATPVLASFVYSGPSRFTDGTFGVYYAARDEQTAIAESAYHTERFMRETDEPSIDLDKRLYTAIITGEYEDIRRLGSRSKLYSLSTYEASARYSRELYEADVVDGIVYRSVRRAGGECVAAYRPRLVTKCRPVKYLQFRWENGRIVGIAQLSVINA